MRRSWAGFIGLMVLTGCTGSVPSTKKDDGQLDILCSFFPIYVFTRNVVGDRDNVAVQLMVPPQRGCPHDYDLTPSDRKKIAHADLFIVNGGGLEEFDEEEVRRENSGIIVVNTSRGIRGIDLEEDEADHAKAEERSKDPEAKGKTAGHSKEHDHAHDAAGHKKDEQHGKHDHDHGGHHHHHGHLNPHFFSSPREAAQQVRNIVLALAKADPAGAQTYEANGKALAGRLEKLADEFRSAAASFENKRIVTTHEVFDYLARDCALEIVGTIHSAANQEPTTAQTRALVDTIRERKAAAIFTEPQYPLSERIARTLSNETGVSVHQLDPVAGGPEGAPLDYYETKMRDNLELLTKSLGKSGT